MPQDPRITEHVYKSEIKNRIKDSIKPCRALLLMFWLIFILTMAGHYGGLY